MINIEDPIIDALLAGKAHPIIVQELNVPVSLVAAFSRVLRYKGYQLTQKPGKRIKPPTGRPKKKAPVVEPVSPPVSAPVPVVNPNHMITGSTRTSDPSPKKADGSVDWAALLRPNIK